MLANPLCLMFSGDKRRAIVTDIREQPETRLRQVYIKMETIGPLFDTAGIRQNE
jgi:hypothetical protein